MTPETADLFAGLQVHTKNNIMPAARLEIGWEAWRMAMAPQAGRWQRLRFWLALWRHVGQARYLVQVGEEYRVASSVSLRQCPDGSGLEARLLQSATPWQFLWHYLRRDKRRYLTLKGRLARISRMSEQAGAIQPLLPANAGHRPCIEVLIDGNPGALPLKVSYR